MVRGDRRDHWPPVSFQGWPLVWVTCPMQMWAVRVAATEHIGHRSVSFVTNGLTQGAQEHPQKLLPILSHLQC